MFRVGISERVGLGEEPKVRRRRSTPPRQRSARAFFRSWLAVLTVLARFVFARVAAAGSLQLPQGAAERIDLPFIQVFLALGELGQFQDLFHLIERLLEGRDDLRNLFDGLTDGGTFRLRFRLAYGAAHWWWCDGDLDGRFGCDRGRRFSGHRRDCGRWFGGGGGNSRHTGGASATASAAATTMASQGGGRFWCFTV